MSQFRRPIFVHSSWGPSVVGVPYNKNFVFFRKEKENTLKFCMVWPDPAH